MTKSELIKRIAQQVEIPPFQAINFMEIFLSLLRANIPAGKTFFLKEIGEFRPVHINLSNKISVSNYVDAILFQGSDSFAEDKHLFDLPSSDSAAESKVDTLMNLSFDKPIMPQEMANDSDSFLMYSGSQNKGFLSEKAEALITLGEIKEIASIESFLSISDLKTKMGESNQESDLWKTIDQMDSKSESNQAESDWEFGGDWKREVEREDLLNELDSSDWNFGSDVKPEPKLEGEISFDDLENSGREDSKFNSDYVPIPSMTREFQIDLSELEDDEDVSHKELFSPPDPMSFVPNQDLDSLFKKSIAESFLFAVPDPILKQDEERRKAKEIAREKEEKAYLENEYSLRKRLESDEAEGADSGGAADFISLNKRREEAKETSGFNPRSLIRNQLPNLVKKRKPIVWVILSAIFIVGIGVTLYVYRFGVPQFVDDYLNPKEVIELPPIIATVVERDYNIPVTYPYKAALHVNDIPMLGIDSVKIEAQPIIKAIVPKTDSLVKSKQETNKIVTAPPKPVTVPEKQTQIKTKVETSASSLVKGNIFREGDIYTVQISSWKDKIKAEQEVSRLTRLGHPAYVQSAAIAGKGKWYRVRVGEFKTLQEAEDYANKLK